MKKTCPLNTMLLTAALGLVGLFIGYAWTLGAFRSDKEEAPVIVATPAPQETLDALLAEPAAFAVGDVVRWRPGLVNKTSPRRGELAVVVEVPAAPIFEDGGDAGSTYFREPLTVKLGRLDGDDDYGEYYYDARRFEKSDQEVPTRLAGLREELEKGQPLAIGTTATWKQGLINRVSSRKATFLVVERLDPPLVTWGNSGGPAFGETLDVKVATQDRDGDLIFRYLDSRRLRPIKDDTGLKALVEAYNDKDDLAPRDRVRWKKGMRNKQAPGYGEIVTVTATLAEPVTDSEGDPQSSYFREPLDTKVAWLDKSGDLDEYHLDSHRLEKVEEP